MTSLHVLRYTSAILEEINKDDHNTDDYKTTEPFLNSNITHFKKKKKQSPGTNLSSYSEINQQKLAQQTIRREELPERNSWPSLEQTFVG